MKFLILAAAAAVLSACSGQPIIHSGADPSDPTASVPTTRYVPVAAGTIDYQPVAPKPWPEQNRRVAPRSEGK